MTEQILSGYYIHNGSSLDRALLVKFMQRTYQELFPQQNFSHLALTVEQYFSLETPLWWITQSPESINNSQVGCLWAGNAIDQVQGDRHTHIFLLYVAPEHRRRGIGKALMSYIEHWAKQRGDRQIGLQVFLTNQSALNLYTQLGYQTQSFSMIKHIS